MVLDTPQLISPFEKATWKEVKNIQDGYAEVECKVDKSIHDNLRHGKPHHQYLKTIF